MTRRFSDWADVLFNHVKQLTLDRRTQAMLRERRSTLTASKEAWLDEQFVIVRHETRALSAELPHAMRYARPTRTHWHVAGTPVDDRRQILRDHRGSARAP